MKFRKLTYTVPVFCSLLIGLTGCSSSDDDSVADKRTTGSNNDDEASDGGSEERAGQQIEMFSWWTATGPAEALRALVDLHESRHPKDSFYNAAEPDNLMAGEDARKVLEQRFADDDPPDLFQTNAFAMRQFLDANPGKVEALDDLFKEEGLLKAVAPEVLKDVTIDGHIYAVPVNIHRENTLYYNMQVFKDNDLEPPKTIEDFFSVCEKLKAEGVTPLAMSTSASWIVLKLFMALAVGSMGPEAFIDNFNGNKPLDEAELSAAIDLLDKVLAEYIDVEEAHSADYGWPQAADMMHAGKAAMFIHGDWVKAYLVQIGWTPNVDFGVVSSPDAEGVFLYGMDVFGVPNGAKHAEGARDFVRTAASVEGQIAFNTIKGSSPIRLDVPTDDFDAMGKAVAAEFKNADARVAQPPEQVAWKDGLFAFANPDDEKFHDKAALLAAFIDNPVAK